MKRILGKRSGYLDQGKKKEWPHCTQHIGFTLVPTTYRVNPSAHTVHNRSLWESDTPQAGVTNGPQKGKSPDPNLWGHLYQGACPRHNTSGAASVMHAAFTHTAQRDIFPNFLVCVQPLLRACITSDDPRFRQKVLAQLPRLVGPMDHAALHVLVAFSISRERASQGLTLLQVGPLYAYPTSAMPSQLGWHGRPVGADTLLEYRPCVGARTRMQARLVGTWANN